MSQVPAFIATLPREQPPEDFQAAWESAGFACRSVDLAALRQSQETPPPLTVLWVGQSWNRGVARLAELPEPLRTLTILVGESPSKRISAGIRESGGLAGFSWPLPSWAPAALTDTVERSQHPAEEDLVAALESLEAESLRLPEELLGRTVQVAQRLTGSDGALLMVGTPKARGAYVLTSNAHGGHLERAAVVAERLSLPVEAMQIIPSSLKVLPGPPSSLVIPLVVHPSGIAGSFKPLDGAILLFWRQPHLSTVRDLRRLEALAGVARVALLQLFDLALSASRQHILSRSLSDLSRSPGGDLAGGPENSVRNILFAFAGCAGLLALWTRISASSRQEGEWISFPPQPAIARPDFLDGETSGPYQGIEEAWTFFRPFPGAPGFGHLIAVFDSKKAAESSKGRLQQLSENLFLAARLIRRTKNSQTMDELSRLSEKKSALDETGKAVEVSLDADGAKIFVMERDPMGKRVRQLFSSLAKDQQEDAKKTVRFKSEDRGFADWVLDTGDWLLIPNLDTPREQIGRMPERCLTGRHGVIFRRARSEAEYIAGLPPDQQDREKTMLFYPLASGNQVAGVLAVWRNSPHPFHEDFDVESFSYLAPYVAATCQRVLRQKKAAEQERETALLARNLSRAKSLAEAYTAVARGVGKIAEAACSIFLYKDPEDPARLWQSAVWMSEQIHQTAKKPHLPTVSIGETSPEDWSKAVEKQCTGNLKGLRFRSLLRPPRESPTFAVALFDPADDDAERLFFSDDLLKHFAGSYLQFAAGLLETHVSAFASRLLDKIGRSSSTDPRTPQDILERTAEILKTAANADAVLVYTGTPKHMKVRFPQSENKEALAFEVLPRSLTMESLRTLKVKRLLDTEKMAPLARQERFQVIARSLGWETVRSWLCCPIVHEDQCTGLIKLLTRENGAIFGRDHEMIVGIVAKRTALEMYKAGRRVVLEDLLQLSNELAGLVGERLGQAMVEHLKRWVGQRLLRPRCEVAIVSWLETGGALIKKASAGVSEGILDYLNSLSIGWDREEKDWSSESPDVGQDSIDMLPGAGRAVPIWLPGIKLLGHLIFLDEEPFKKDEVESLRQAASSMAVLLNGERERLMEKQAMGRFRHAVIGPVQGVSSAAHFLALLAEEAGADKEQVERLRTRLSTEVEVVRLWKENQRFYQNDGVQIKARRQFLKPVVERCVERFRAPLVERGIALHLDWRYQGGLLVSFDADALDLVLSNLLDNARKYSFAKQTVTVGAQLREKDDQVAIWVENVGHGLPENVQMYGLGARFVKDDKWRAIGGEGLGLHMSAAIVREHGGTLTHSSVKIADGRSPETTPYRVRFIFAVPLSWRPH
jgi:signal transduction histidine kinase